MICRRCGHVITKEDVKLGVASKVTLTHITTLCKTLTTTYGRRKKW